MAVVAPMSGVPYTLQNAQTTGNGDVVTPPPSFRNHTITIQGSAGVATGAIQVETSDNSAYSGTWVAQGSAVTVVASAEAQVTITGVFTAVRARISTTVTGGTVSVTYLGAKSY